MTTKNAKSKAVRYKLNKKIANLAWLKLSISTKPSFRIQVSLETSIVGQNDFKVEY